MPRVPLGYPLAALAVFTGLLVAAVGGWPPLGRVDVAVIDGARRFAVDHPAWIDPLRVLTNAGAIGVFLAAVGVAALVALMRRWHAGAVTAALVMITVPICAAAGRLLPRPRPAGTYVDTHGYGFPSGHASNASALALLAVLLLWPSLRRLGRVLAVVAALLYAAGVAATRVMLLAHWPSDVVGGALLAAGLVPLCAAIGTRLARQPAPR